MVAEGLAGAVGGSSNIAASGVSAGHEGRARAGGPSARRCEDRVRSAPVWLGRACRALGRESHQQQPGLRYRREPCSPVEPTRSKTVQSTTDWQDTLYCGADGRGGRHTEPAPPDPILAMARSTSGKCQSFHATLSGPKRG